MTTHPFFTQSPRLAYLKRLVQENSRLDFDLQDIRRLLQVVDQRCSSDFPIEDRGGWLSPLALGGAQLDHIPPYIIFTILAIYAHLASGDVDPVPFLAGPLGTDGITPVQVHPSDQFQIMDRDLQAYPLTDILFVHPSRVPVGRTLDLYGLPNLRENVEVIGWHAAAQPQFTAVVSGQALVLRFGKPNTFSILSRISRRKSRRCSLPNP